MGSVKKKVNKVFNKAADKLIPKELAPFLPYASMLLPFVGGPMSGIMSSTLGRYAIPQMLTALGSAKTTGEVDLKKQALAAASSYLGGPGDESATNMEKAYLKQNPNAATSTTSAGVPNAISGANGPVNTTFQDFTKIDPDALNKFAKTYKPTGNAFLSNAKDFGTGLQRAAGGSEGFFKQASLIGSPMLTMGGIDLAEKTIREQKEDIANRKMGIKKYMDSTDDLSEYYRDLAPDYDQLYGGLDFAKRFMNEGGRVGYNAGSLVSSPGVSSDRMNELIKFAMDDGASIQEAFEYAKRMAAGETQLNKGGRVGMNGGGSPSTEVEPYDLEKDFIENGIPAGYKNIEDYYEDNFTRDDSVNELIKFAMDDGASIQEAFEYAKRMAAGETQLNNGGRVGMNTGGSPSMSDMLNNALGGKDSSGLNKLFLLDALSNFQGSDGVMSLLGPLLGMNKGGRVGLNMGGMGSIPQTPMVPQGQQLDGRGGGFIPMGAQEKKDDVPAMLAKNEFVMTSDAVRAAGGGSIQKGAQRMYDTMNQLEAQV